MPVLQGQWERIDQFRWIVPKSSKAGMRVDEIYDETAADVFGWDDRP